MQTIYFSGLLAPSTPTLWSSSKSWRDCHTIFSEQEATGSKRVTGMVKSQEHPPYSWPRSARRSATGFGAERELG